MSFAIVPLPRLLDDQCPIRPVRRQVGGAELRAACSFKALANLAAENDSLFTFAAARKSGSAVSDQLQ